MKNRREFIKIGGLGALAFSVARTFGAASNSNGASGPVIVSTWNHGVPANDAAYKMLVSGGSVLDAVEAGVKVPEGDPHVSSVGYGGLPDRDGRVTLDACIMDFNGGCGAVACIEHIKHPVSVARKVMENTPHVFLVGDGALQFALASGFEKEDLLTPESKAAWENWLKDAHYKPKVNWENHDTIGLLAMDADGRLAGACTTSGMAYKMHGRVGDSPIIGAGLFVDNEVGAATSTGVGEEVIRICGSHLVVELMRSGARPEAACKEAVDRIIRNKGGNVKDLQVGFLALNKKGEFGAWSIQKGFNYAVKSSVIPNKLIDSKSSY